MAKAGMEAAQESANNETKSSAGDKYETGRAMSQNERDLFAKQLVEQVNQLKGLLTIDPSKKMDSVEVGSLVETKSGVFFISVSLGLVKLKAGETAMVISPISPIAQLMLEKKEGGSFVWQGKEQSILSIA
ncbi:MAG: transcription elongation factor [Reichenbachiella sp.]